MSRRRSIDTVYRYGRSNEFMFPRFVCLFGLVDWFVMADRVDGSYDTRNDSSGWKLEDMYRNKHIDL